MSPQEIADLMALAKANGLLPLGPADEIAAALNSQRPKVRLPGDGRELLHFAHEVGDILSNQNLFRRDRAPVIVNPSKARLDSMSPQMLRSWSQRHVVFFKDKQIGSGGDSHTIDIVKTMNVDTARGLLESYDFVERLPEIEKVNPTRLPVMRRDQGIEMLGAGYYQEQRIYTLDDGLEYDYGMTLEQAREVIDHELQHFPFRDDGRSKAVAIAGMLTMFGAGLLPKGALRPGFIYTANSPGAGKTLLAKLAIIPVVGSAAPRSFPRKEEMKKVLDTIAMDASTYVLFDNIRGQIGGEDVESFITASEWEGRILGESSKFRVDNVATVFMTGNESKTTQDMQERCLFVELFVQEADNRDRQIPRVIDDPYLSSPAVRSRLCSAMWAMVRAWDADGRPPAPSRLARFEQWSSVIGAIVAHAGYGDPCRRAEVAGRGEVQQMRELVCKLFETPDDDDAAVSTWNFSEIIEEVQEHGLFEALVLRGKKGEEEEMFAEDGKLTPAGRSFCGRFLAKYDQRLFASERGERLRWVVQGKGNQRKYVVVREADSAVAAAVGE